MDDSLQKQSENMTNRNFDSVLTERFKYNLPSSYSNSDDIVMNKIDVPQKQEEEEEEEEEEAEHSEYLNKRKSNHNEIEKRRIKNLKDKIESLKNILEMNNKLKRSDKLSVLDSTCSFILETENNIKQLKEQINNRYMELKNSRSSEYQLDYYDTFKFCSIPSAIISINGLITDCNNQFCLIFNKPYESIINQSVFLIVPNEDLSLFYYYISTLIGDNISGKCISFEYNMMCNGKEVKLHNTLQYIKNEDQIPFFILNMIQMRITHNSLSTISQSFKVQRNSNEIVINSNVTTALQANEYSADDTILEQLLSGRKSF